MPFITTKDGQAIFVGDKKPSLSDLSIMFSKDEISRGLSDDDLKKRYKEFGISIKKPLTPQEEFKKGALTVKNIDVVKQKRELTQEERDVLLPPTHKEIFTRPKVVDVEVEGKIVEVVQPSERMIVRKKKFLPPGLRPKDPEAEASEAQKEFLLRATGESQTQTTSGEAAITFDRLKRMRTMELVSGFKGGRSTDPQVQGILNKFTPAERIEILERLQRKAHFTSKVIPELLTTKEVFDILRRVKPSAFPRRFG